MSRLTLAERQIKIKDIILLKLEEHIKNSKICRGISVDRIYELVEFQKEPIIEAEINYLNKRAEIKKIENQLDIYIGNRTTAKKLLELHKKNPLTDNKKANQMYELYLSFKICPLEII